MASSFPAKVRVSPHYELPEFVLPFSQPSGFADCIAGGEPRVVLPPEAQYVYAKGIKLTTAVNISQQPFNTVPGCAIEAYEASIPAYWIRSQAMWNHHDLMAAGNWGASLPELERRGARQAAFQNIRAIFFSGVNAANGEGILNAPGTVQATLPPDTFGNTTFSTYDNGQMLLQLNTNISNLITRMFQFGTTKGRIVVIGPQKYFGGSTLTGIIQLTSVQRPGAGSETVPQSAIRIMKEAMDWEIHFTYDDTLIGLGAGGTDAIIIVAPELEPNNAAKFDTNTFITVSPNMDANVLQLVDMAAPKEIPVPQPWGYLHTGFEMKSTPGWTLRPEGVTIWSMSF